MAVHTQTATGTGTATHRLYGYAAWLAVLTIVYNLAEGVVSVALGSRDETIALFGFGVDSFVEVLSGIGILHMVLRLRTVPSAGRDTFERRALRITGTAFYLLAAGLVLTVVATVVEGSRPETTVAGMAISVVSIAAMWLLIRAKESVGYRLNSPAIIADARCTRSCLYLSFVLLASSAGYELTGIGLLDAVGAAGVAWFAWREGKESFDKARGVECCSCSNDGHCG